MQVPTGGEGTPFRINFIPLGHAPLDELRKHAEMASGVPYVTKKSSATRLAIVGMGPSVLAKIPRLEDWDGDIWAINGACAWLAKRGIRSFLTTVDPAEMPDSMLDGVESAILASCAHPKAFEVLKGRVEKFDLSDYADDGIGGGCTTASRLPALAIKLGYTEITYFGCEGSHSGIDHVNGHSGDEIEVIVRAGGEDYRVSPEFLMQSVSLAQLIREWPEIFKEESGGILRAIVAHPDTWEVVAVSEKLKEQLEAHNGECGLFDSPYEGKH